MTHTNGMPPSRAPGRRPEGDAFTGSWLASRLGVEPRALDVRRRAGELLAVRDPSRADYVYPVWQFDRNLEPLPAVGRFVRAAREAGLDDEALHELLLRRDGLTGRGRLVEALRMGREEYVLGVIRSAARGELGPSTR